MADLRIVDTPLLSTVKGTEKIPTGGEGNFSVSVNQVADFAKLKWFLATEEYVDNAVGNVQADLNLHKNNESNPHNVTKTQVGLSNVDNTADLDKPVSNASIASLSLKADKITTYTKTEVDSEFYGIYQNGAALPYDATMEYVEGAVVVKDGELQKKQGASWVSATNKGYNLDYFISGKSYPLHAEIMLTNGDTVRSTTVNNIVDPNIDTTGWFNESKSKRDIVIKAKRDNGTIYDYGAIGDGTLHTVEEWYTVGSTNHRGYANLAAVQVDYPFVTDKDFSVDQAAILKLTSIRSATGGGIVDLSIGHFIVKPINNAEMMLIPAKITIAGRGDGTIIESITDLTDSPNEVSYWDMFLFKGTDNIGGGAKDFIIRQTGGRRINAGAVVLRQGAARKKFKNIKFESAIASCIATEGNVVNEVFTGTKITGCEFRPNGRHGVYIIGAKGNKVYNNTFYISALESIAVRAFSDNLIENNDFFGVVGVDAHAICLAQPPVGTSYKVNNLVVKNNYGYDLRGAFFYGQGSGTQMYDSVVSGNSASQALDYTGTAHVFQFYRTERCDLSNNSIGFARNRAIQLYGCKGNNLTKTAVKNANDVGATVGTILLSSYTDPVEAVEVFSIGNVMSDCKFIDDRTTQKHVYAIQMLAGNNKNIVSRNTYIGGSATRISSADGLNTQNVGENTEQFLFTKAAMALGTVASSYMLIGGNSSTEYVSKDAYIKEFRVYINQVVSSGTVTVRLYKNGSALVSNTITGNGSIKTNALYYQPLQYNVSVGDFFAVTVESSATTSGQGQLDVSCSIILAE